MPIDIIDVQNDLKKHLKTCIALLDEKYESPIEHKDASHRTKLKAMLERKIDDVTQLQIRMTIIAPMKAGKSTIINALIGRECLPSRSDAMTVLPIEVILKQAKNNIKHTTCLILTEQNRSTIKSIYLEVQRLLKLHTENDSGDKNFANLLKKNVNLMKAAKSIETRYEDSIFTRELKEDSDIREMLTLLNDLIRIYVGIRSAKMVTYIPQETEQCTKSITSTDDESSQSKPDEKMTGDDFLAKLTANIPRLEVIYERWRPDKPSNSQEPDGPSDKSESCQLVLVDTPGPNDAMVSGELENIVHQELEKADIVLVTFNFTNLNTNDDQNIADDIKKIHTIKGSSDAIYALVNKVDQRRSGDMTEEDTKAYISATYKIPEDRIFELKAVHALRAHLFFVENEKANDYSNSCLKGSALDVLREVFPSRWQTMQKRGVERADLIEYANELYEGSGLNEFIDATIETVRKQIIRRCFRSTVDMHDFVCTSFEESTTKRKNGLMIDAEILNREQELLTKDSDDISKLKETFYKVQTISSDAFEKQLTIIFDTHKSYMENEMKSLFDENSTRWRNPSTWRAMIREQRFAMGVLNGVVGTATVAAGLMASAPIAIGAATVAIGTFVGTQTAGYYAEDQNVVRNDVSAAEEPPGNQLIASGKTLLRWMAKTYAAVFTKDEARFDTVEDANEFIAKVKESANKISQDYYRTISSAVETLCTNTSNELFKKLNDDSSTILQRAKKRSSELFKVELKVACPDGFEIENVTKANISAVARYRPYYGFWLFERDVIDPSTREKATKHCVSRKELENICLKVIETNRNNIKDNIIEKTREAIAKKLNDHFQNLQYDLQTFMNEVQSSLMDKHMAENDKKTLISNLETTLQKIQERKIDFENFRMQLHKGGFEFISIN